MNIALFDAVLHELFTDYQSFFEYPFFDRISERICGISQNKR